MDMWRALAVAISRVLPTAAKSAVIVCCAAIAPRYMLIFKPQYRLQPSTAPFAGSIR